MAASPLPQAQLPIHAVAKRIATLHAKWAEPAHPPGLLHRRGEWERTPRIKVTSGAVGHAVAMVHAIAPGSTAISAASE